MQDLSFKGNDPGAVRYGNFINYYQFHSPEARINTLPKNIWNSLNNNDFYSVLDIGCNCGDLTLALHQFLNENINDKKIETLGIDIDENLILRANEKRINGLNFKSMDIMSDNSKIEIENHLKLFNKAKFDAIFCFSTTMWIHLNYGDEGLMTFLRFICEKTDMLVIEPQPWKCYRNAVRRMKKSSETFPLYEELKLRSNVDEDIKDSILETGLFQCIFESKSTDWLRKCLFFKRKTF